MVIRSSMRKHILEISHAVELSDGILLQVDSTKSSNLADIIFLPLSKFFYDNHC